MKGFGAGGMQKLMQQANQMQSKMKKAQDEFAKKEFTGTAGGDAVTATVSGEYLISSLQINPEILKDGDAEMASEMVLLAVNDAIKTAKAEYKKEMDGITGGMGMPGMM